MCARLPRFRRLSSRRAPPSSAKERERSEEHTSELQSQSNLVCRLLLEKKKLQRSRRASSALEHASISFLHWLEHSEASTHCSDICCYYSAAPATHWPHDYHLCSGACDG